MRKHYTANFKVQVVLEHSKEEKVRIAPKQPEWKHSIKLG